MPFKPEDWIKINCGDLVTIKEQEILEQIGDVKLDLTVMTVDTIQGENDTFKIVWFEGYNIVLVLWFRYGTMSAYSTWIEEQGVRELPFDFQDEDGEIFDYIDNLKKVSVVYDDENGIAHFQDTNEYNGNLFVLEYKFETYNVLRGCSVGDNDIRINLIEN